MLACKGGCDMECRQGRHGVQTGMTWSADGDAPVTWSADRDAPVAATLTRTGSEGREGYAECVGENAKSWVVRHGPVA